MGVLVHGTSTQIDCADVLKVLHDIPTVVAQSCVSICFLHDLTTLVKVLCNSPSDAQSIVAHFCFMFSASPREVLNRFASIRPWRHQTAQIWSDSHDYIFEWVSTFKLASWAHFLANVAVCSFRHLKAWFHISHLCGRSENHNKATTGENNMLYWLSGSWSSSCL